MSFQARVGLTVGDIELSADLSNNWLKQKGETVEVWLAHYFLSRHFLLVQRTTNRGERTCNVYECSATGRMRTGKAVHVDEDLESALTWLWSTFIDDGSGPVEPRSHLPGSIFENPERQARGVLERLNFAFGSLTCFYVQVQVGPPLIVEIHHRNGLMPSKVGGAFQVQVTPKFSFNIDFKAASPAEARELAKIIDYCAMEA